jgi:hypothetical protein
MLNGILVYQDPQLTKKIPVCAKNERFNPELRARGFSTGHSNWQPHGPEGRIELASMPKRDSNPVIKKNEVLGTILNQLVRLLNK